MSEEANVIRPDFFAYPAGDALEGTEAAAVSQAAPTRVIVVAGAAGSGKTTLVAGLYDLFHFGPFAGFAFAGSRSFVGLEKRCHLARIASGQEEPDTERTRRTSSQQLLHLRVKQLNGSLLSNMLFTDIYGEAFRLAADSTDECRQLGVLKRADHMVLLLDGEKLAEIGGRHQAVSSIDNLLRGCVETEMLDATCHVELVVTKWDLVLKAENPNDVKQFIATKIQWLLNRYATRLGSMNNFAVAIRPRADSGLTLGYGVDSVFQRWATQSRLALIAQESIPKNQYSCEFDRFAKVVR